MSVDLNETVGSAAGKVWTFLSENGQASATKLAESTGLDRNDVQRAIGWLAREGKLTVELKGKNEFFSLVRG
ncbi:winged helix-turn-helix domain-containing protein [Candidatus Methylocalor cossyra]|uniref:Winged helix-turn-helix domain-containing protein n=1 Tax=Candidatus Methylocalor cossyra TaxID=3108543 RepID=A0ABP1C598_9GAMM